MNMHIENTPETQVIYLRRTGPYGGDNRDLMERLKSWAAGNDLLETNTILGIAWDDPAQTPPERGAAARRTVRLLRGASHNRGCPGSLAGELCRPAGAWALPGPGPSGDGALPTGTAGAGHL